MKRMVIGLCGQAGSGKSTVAEFLVRERGFVRLRFAGPLKAMLSAFLAAMGVPGEEAARMVDGDLKQQPHPVLAGRTPRYTLQTLGTEWGRDLMAPDFWTGALIEGVERALAKGARGVVVDDVRFPNEAVAIQQALGGVLVRIDRPGLPLLDVEHPSEDVHLLHPSVIILNDDTKGLLWMRLRYALELPDEHGYDVGGKQSGPLVAIGDANPAAEVPRVPRFIEDEVQPGETLGEAAVTVAGQPAAAAATSSLKFIEGADDEEGEGADGNLVRHAKRELAHLLEGADEDERTLAENLVACVAKFSEFGHSGGSAGWAVPALANLLAYKPIRPLTGEDDEWTHLGYDDECWAQNKRCSHVFKRKDGTAYDIQAVAFRDPDGSTWNNYDSRRDVTFPYTPKTEVVDRPAESDPNSQEALAAAEGGHGEGAL